MIERHRSQPDVTDPSGWKPVWKINGAFLRAAAGFGLAWLFWQAAQLPGFELVLYLAAVFVIVGVKHAGVALIELIKWIWRIRRWAKYRRQGSAPKADRIASEADLRARGLIK